MIKLTDYVFMIFDKDAESYVGEGIKLNKNPKIWTRISFARRALTIKCFNTPRGELKDFYKKYRIHKCEIKVLEEIEL